MRVKIITKWISGIPILFRDRWTFYIKFKTHCRFSVNSTIMQSTATQHAVNAVIMRVVSLRMGWPVCFQTFFFCSRKKNDFSSRWHTKVGKFYRINMVKLTQKQYFRMINRLMTQLYINQNETSNLIVSLYLQ